MLVVNDPYTYYAPVQSTGRKWQKNLTRSHHRPLHTCPARKKRSGLLPFLLQGRFPRHSDRQSKSTSQKKSERTGTTRSSSNGSGRAIVAQKDDYWKPVEKRSLQYTKAYSVLGYLAYHFPVYFMQTEHLLAMLARDGLLKKSMTILDIGTGPGVVPLAIADFWSRLDGAKADVYSVERSEEHIEAFLYLRDRFVPKGGKVSVKPPVKADITASDPVKIPQQVDLLVFSNVLNELSDKSPEERADIVMHYAERLAPDGTILIVEPAEETVSTQLRVLSLALKKRGLDHPQPLHVYLGHELHAEPVLEFCDSTRASGRHGSWRRLLPATSRSGT